ncbi:hypothetical protein Bca52824_088432 [Brassica carinata]|uniref:Thioredoxin-like fold domain-containing protein n=1 Tax=Brassica carinata TaxID=52824 RepID=A0A8X7TP72_BRACI|nr:hypothetical protein Bca52824_088432 [Brassica carinata]
MDDLPRKWANPCASGGSRKLPALTAIDTAAGEPFHSNSGSETKHKSVSKERMIRTAFLFLVLVIGTQVHAQLVPPARLDGFVYPPGRRVDPDTILIEAFFNPVCPDSRDAWPPLKQALKHYGSRVALLLHLLPLPYHDNAYIYRY